MDHPAFTIIKVAKERVLAWGGKPGYRFIPSST